MVKNLRIEAHWTANDSSLIESSIASTFYFKKKKEMKVFKESFSWTKGKLNKIEHNVVTFDGNIDCLFVQELNILLVFITSKFEKL